LSFAIWPGEMPLLLERFFDHAQRLALMLGDNTHHLRPIALDKRIEKLLPQIPRLLDAVVDTLDHVRHTLTEFWSYLGIVKFFLKPHTGFRSIAIRPADHLERAVEILAPGPSDRS